MAQIKAAFVLNIIRFASWSEAVLPADAPQLHLCLFEDPVLAVAFEGIRGKGVGARKLDIRVVETPDGSCQALFVPESRLSWLGRRGTSGSAGLLVISDRTGDESEQEPFAGEMISLIRQESRIAFEIDIDATKAAGIELSSELLKLGRIVRHDR